ncbi:MAG: hypothetical protein ABSH08_17350 [Tepidisphaeraceae bacterium]|jgi:hypothetical protein
MTRKNERSRPKTAKDPNIYPPDMNYKKVAAIAKFYDEQRDVDIFSEIEAAANNKRTVMIQVPRHLLPEILRLINKRRKSA